MKRLKDAVLRLDKDFFDYWFMDDRNEYNSLNEYIISHLEHELYDIYEEEQEDPGSTVGTWIDNTNKRKVERIINNYYANKYINE